MRAANPLRCIVLLALLIAATGQAKDYFSLPALPEQHPSHAQLIDIAKTGDRLVAVGERGIIIYSDDGGKQWQQAVVPVSYTLTAVSFPGGPHGWAVGHGGVILHSNDSGETWKLQFDGNDANRSWLEFTQNQVAKLKQQVDTAQLGDQTAQEGSAGERQIAAPAPAQEDLALQLEDAQYAVEDAETAIKAGPNDPFLDVWFRDEKTGFATGAYGMLYRTRDGGFEWKLLAGGIDNIDRYHYYSLGNLADGTLFLAGETGILYRSANDGETWESLASPYDGSLFGVTVAADQSVLVYGLRGNIFRSEDKGDSWQPIDNDSALSLYGGTRLANDHLIMVGASGVILESRDNGLTFTSDTHSSRTTFAAVTANANNDLLVVGMEGLVVIGHRSATASTPALQGAE